MYIDVNTNEGTPDQVGDICEKRPACLYNYCGKIDLHLVYLFLRFVLSCLLKHRCIASPSFIRAGGRGLFVNEMHTNVFRLEKL